MILCIWAVASLVAAEWFGISKMPQRISDRLFNYSVHLSNYEVTERAPYLGETWARIGDATWKHLDRATVEVLVGERV